MNASANRSTLPMLFVVCIATVLTTGCVFVNDDDRRKGRQSLCLSPPYLCQEGERQVPHCDGDEHCQERESCGYVMHCTTTPAPCEEVPVCDDQYVEVGTSCDEASADSCVEVSACEQTIACEMCPQPTCPGGGVEVAECEPGDASCVTVVRTDTTCQSEILCKFPDTCATPVCEDGYGEYGSSCDGVEDCYETTACGTTVACVPATCLGLLGCDDGQEQVTECPSNDPHCHTIEYCGVEIHCQEPPMTCTAVPTCEDGYTANPNGCPNDGSVCYLKTVCGTTIGCVEDP